MPENREQGGSMNTTQYTGWMVLDAEWSIKTMNHALGYDWLPKMAWYVHVICMPWLGTTPNCSTCYLLDSWFNVQKESVHLVCGTRQSRFRTQIENKVLNCSSQTEQVYITTNDRVDVISKVIYLSPDVNLTIACKRGSMQVWDPHWLQIHDKHHRKFRYFVNINLKCVTFSVA